MYIRLTRKQKELTKDWVSIIAVTVFLILILFPMYWIISTAFKSRPDILSSPPVFFRFTPTLSNFEPLIGGQRDFVPTLWNSLVVAIGSTLVTLVLGTTTAYALSRWQFKRNKDLAFYIISTRILPPITVAIPIYMIFRTIGLVNTYAAIIIAHIAFNFPIVVWMMKTFFDDLPVELEESARVEGCNVPGAFSRIALPLCAPGLVASGILAFIFSWNEFLFALILTGGGTRTIPVALAGFQSSIGRLWGEMAAGAFIGLIPVIAFSLFAQRYLVRGLTAGAIK